MPWRGRDKDVSYFPQKTLRSQYTRRHSNHFPISGHIVGGAFASCNRHGGRTQCANSIMTTFFSISLPWTFIGWAKYEGQLSGDGDDRLFVVQNFTLLSFSHIKRKRWSPVCCDLLLSIWLHAFATFLYVHLRHLVGEYCRRKKRKHERLFQSSSFDVTLSYIHGSFIFIIQQQKEWEQNIKRSTPIRQ